MIALSQIEPVAALGPLRDAVLRGPVERSFGAQLGAAADALSGALARADAAAGAVAAGSANIASAAIARARADVMLEIAAIAASRVSGAVTTLLQTQV